jgi:hypothetical protein
MSYFPSLSEVSSMKSKKTNTNRQAYSERYVSPQTQPQPQPQTQQPQKATAFVWAKLVNGEKKDIAMVEAEEKAKKEAAFAARVEKEAREKEAEKEAELRAKLFREGRAAEFAKINAIRIEEAKAQQKKADEKYARENGWWENRMTYREVEEGEPYSTPFPNSKVNEKSLQFLQLWLSEFPELAKITTIGELQAAFYSAFVPWVQFTSPRSSSSLAAWEEQKYVGQKFNNAELQGRVKALLAQDKPDEAAEVMRTVHQLNATRYWHFQEWVGKEEKEYNESAYKHPRSSPWVQYDIWIKAKHITWENVLFAMSKISGAFPNGLIEIQGHFSKPTSQIKWVVSLEPYLATRFASKPESAAKRRRLDEEEYEDYCW